MKQDASNCGQSKKEFLVRLVAELDARGVDAPTAAVAAFVESAWPLVVTDPVVERWSTTFTEEFVLEQMTAYI